MDNNNNKRRLSAPCACGAPTSYRTTSCAPCFEARRREAQAERAVDEYNVTLGALAASMVTLYRANGWPVS